MAESKSQQELLSTRTSKEEWNIELLEQQKKQEKELHNQRMAHERELHMWAKDRRWDEEELHHAKMADLGIDIGEIRRRRPKGNDAQTQTSDSDL